MRAVIQRVKSSAVFVAGQKIAQIGAGLNVLLAVEKEDTRIDLEWLARKIIDLRIFEDAQGKFNLALGEVKGEILLISQFIKLHNKQS